MTIIEHPLPPDSGSAPKRKTLLEILRWLIFGTPIASEQEGNTLVRKIVALPVFCSDAISSVAYGGQQVLLALCTAGLWLPQYKSMYAGYVMEISCAILFLLVVV